MDLQELMFLDSSGLSVLLGVAKGARTPPLARIAGPERVQKVFEITDTARHFTWIHAT